MASKHVEASQRFGALMLLTICDVLALLTRKLKTVEDAYEGFPIAKQSCIVVQTEHIIVEDWHYSEFLVTFRNVWLDCEDIIDARRLKRFDADSEFHVFVQSLTNKDIKPSPQFGVALSTLWLEHYVWDPGSSAALMGGYFVDASGNVTQYSINGRDLYGIYMRCKADSLVTFGRSNNIYSQWLDVHESTRTVLLSHDTDQAPDLVRVGCMCCFLSLVSSSLSPEELIISKYGFFHAARSIKASNCSMVKLLIPPWPLDRLE